MDTAEEIHRPVLDALITRAAPGSATFGHLLASLSGADPADTAEALDRLAAQQLIDPAAADRLNPHRQPRQATRHDGTDDHILPRPHPLDYDWRFTTRAAERLRSRCLQLTSPGDTIALLGTPTILKASATRAKRRHWKLLEANAAITTVLAQLLPGAVTLCDLTRDELPELGAQVVVADPPWYPEHTRAFLWAAARVSMVGATVLLAQPGVGTRPGILSERAGLLAYARECGLHTTLLCPGILEYACPPFERRTLESRGLADAVPLNWRRGDLIELAHAAALQPDRPAFPEGQPWKEVVLGGVRLRFRLDQPSPDGCVPADPQLIRLADRDRLPSVSRREPVRRNVTVWTAGNRVFGCRSPWLLAGIAAALASGKPVTDAVRTGLGRPPDATEKAHIRQAVGQLTELVRAEQATTAGTDTISASAAARPDPDAGSRS